MSNCVGRCVIGIKTVSNMTINDGFWLLSQLKNQTGWTQLSYFNLVRAIHYMYVQYAWQTIIFRQCWIKPILTDTRSRSWCMFEKAKTFWRRLRPLSNLKMFLRPTSTRLVQTQAELHDCTPVFSSTARASAQTSFSSWGRRGEQSGGLLTVRLRVRADVQAEPSKRRRGSAVFLRGCRAQSHGSTLCVGNATSGGRSIAAERLSRCLTASTLRRTTDYWLGSGLAGSPGMIMKNGLTI